MMPSYAKRSPWLVALFIAVCAPAQEIPQNVSAALKKADAAIAAIIKIPKAKRTFTNTLGALDGVLAQLDVETSLTLFMAYVSTDAEERDAARAADEAVTNWNIALGKREDVYRAVKEYADTKPKLDGEKKRMLEFTLRDFRRAGMALPKDKRSQLQKLEQELNKLGIEFDRNIADDETKVPLTLAELEGVPEAVIARLPRSGELYLAGMDTPTYVGIVENAKSTLTRQKVYVAHKRRGGIKNVRLLERMIKLRAEAAAILGYKNRVDYEIETRMAKNSGNVAKFYAELEPLVRRKAELDTAEFTAAFRQDVGDPNAKLNVWDYAYTKNLLLKMKYAVDSEKVAEYLPMEQVVQGLFGLTSTLYGIEYRDVTSKAASLGLPLWHEDVRLYEIVDKESGKLLGRMYTDLYPRPNKYSHAACWGLRPRKVWPDGKVSVPLAALVCNFTKPTEDKPSLLPHDEVETFFHEFGHGLHNVLTNASLARFSGTAVARDFVEAPSQMMENWVWSAEVLQSFAKHYRTGEALPKETLDGMIRARTLGSGIETSFQMFLGKMDQAFHTAPNGEVDTVKVYLDTFASTLPYPPAPQTFYQASFTHMNGYQGAYYGYLWSLVYAQDLFQRFEEMGVLNPEAGRYYRAKVLGRGGTIDEMAMLRDYLGREPNMEAFLKHLGLSQERG
jgi:thimet oligopeptidase